MNSTDVMAAALKESGLKQMDLAEILKVNRSTISTNMRRDNIGINVFIRLLNTMGYTVMVGQKEGEMFFPKWEVK